MRALPVRTILLRSVKPLPCSSLNEFAVLRALARALLLDACVHTLRWGLQSQPRLIHGVVGVAEGHAAKPMEPFSYAHVVSLNPYSAALVPLATEWWWIRYKDGRLREYEAWSCDDVDSVHNDYQRHLLCPRPP